MEATVTYNNSEHSWSRRCSTETVFSIQGRETDVARDTSDTEAWEDLEYEPVTESEDEAPLDCEESDITDSEIIQTKVIEVSVVEDRDLEFADSEPTDSSESDSEIDFNDYTQCAQCNADNDNPIYRYCDKCFRSRKHFFPPRPKRRLKRRAPSAQRPLSQDSGVESQPHSQDNPGTSKRSSQSRSPSLDSDLEVPGTSNTVNTFKSTSQSIIKDVDTTRLDRKRSRSNEDKNNPGDLELTKKSKSNIEDDHENLYDLTIDNRSNSAGICDKDKATNNRSRSRSISIEKDPKDALNNNKKLDENFRARKRSKSRSVSNDRDIKRSKKSDAEVQTLIKTVSDPAITIEDPVKLTKKVIANTIKEIVADNNDDDNACFVCFTEPKSGVFVHGRVAHICCCYKCALKVWSTTKRCPICNRKVSNVLRAVIV